MAGWTPFAPPRNGSREGQAGGHCGEQPIGNDDVPPLALEIRVVLDVVPATIAHAEAECIEAHQKRAGTAAVAHRSVIANIAPGDFVRRVAKFAVFVGSRVLFHVSQTMSMWPAVDLR